MWPRCLAALERGSLTPIPQSGEAVYAHKIDKAEARLNWSRPARELDCHIRGLAPFPGAWCEMAGKRVKVHMAKVEDGSGEAGMALDDKLLIACGYKALRLTEVQPAGKAKMSAADFLRGHKVVVGTVLR
jgi:methionyl-tRNA formyltransferase